MPLSWGFGLERAKSGGGIEPSWVASPEMVSEVAPL